MDQVQDDELAGSPVGLMAQMRDEQVARTPAAGLMEQIQDDKLAGVLATCLAGTGRQSFWRCKMTQCLNLNLARSQNPD